MPKVTPNQIIGSISREIGKAMRELNIDPEPFALEIDRVAKIKRHYDRCCMTDDPEQMENYLRLDQRLSQGYQNLGILPRALPKQRRGSKPKADEKQPDNALDALRMTIGTAKTSAKAKGSHNSQTGIESNE